MDNIAIREAGFRKQLFDETAARMNLPPPLVEKDFWVCWTLKRIFGLPAGSSDHIIFKGGTTLSKVHGVIERFSEDIDLTIHRSAFGFAGDSDPTNAKSRKKRDKILEEQLKPASRSYIQNDLRESLYTAFNSVLGTEQEHWGLDIAERDPDGQTLLFTYPPAVDMDSSSAYVESAVRLEFGSRGADWPTDQVHVRPYAAEYFPQVFTDPTTEVCAMTGERTFWEKATILHLEANRPGAKTMPERCSRHYYDMAMLANSRVKENALQNMELLASVVEHKKLFFHRGWAQYDKAQPGTLCLSPPDSRLRELQQDYRKMSTMTFGEAPSLEDVLKTIADLETQINQHLQDGAWAK